MSVVVEVPDPRLEETIEYLGADPVEDRELVAELLEQAVLMVDNYVGNADVPYSIETLAIKRVCNELMSQSKTSAATVSGFYETEQAPAMPNRDPMTTAYVILRKWVLPW